MAAPKCRPCVRELDVGHASVPLEFPQNLDIDSIELSAKHFFAFL